MNKFRLHQLTLIAMFGAIGAILMVWRFPLPFLPPFLSMDFSAIPELIGGFALGPIAAIMIIIVKIVIQLVISGTNSMFTGELQNFILSCAFVLPAAIWYKRHKSRKSACIGMGVGIAVCSGISILTNLYIIIPFYTRLIGLTMENIIASCLAVNPSMNSITSMVILGILPFNLLKCFMNCIVTALIYKKISPIIHRYTKQ